MTINTIISAMIARNLMARDPRITSAIVFSLKTSDGTGYHLGLTDLNIHSLPVTLEVPDKETFGDFLNSLLSRSVLSYETRETVHIADIQALFSHPLVDGDKKFYGMFAHIECNDDYSHYELTDYHYTELKETAGNMGDLTEEAILEATGGRDE